MVHKLETDDEYLMIQEIKEKIEKEEVENSRKSRGESKI